MSRYGRGMGLQVLGQGLIRSATDLAAIAQKKKERDIEEKRYRDEGPKRELDLKIAGQQIISNDLTINASKVAENKRADIERKIKNFNEAISDPVVQNVALKNPDLIKKFSGKLGEEMQKTLGNPPPELTTKLLQRSPLTKPFQAPAEVQAETAGVMQNIKGQAEELQRGAEKPFEEQRRQTYDEQLKSVRTKMPEFEYSNIPESKNFFQKETMDIEQQNKLEESELDRDLKRQLSYRENKLQTVQEKGEERRQVRLEYQQLIGHVKATKDIVKSGFLIKNVDNALKEAGSGGIYGEGGIEGVGFGSKLYRKWINSKEGVNVRQSIQLFFLGKAKEQSGVAISDKEFERIETAYGLNARATVDSFRSSFKTAAEETRNSLKQFENSLLPSVYDMLHERDMFTSDEIPSVDNEKISVQQGTDEEEEKKKQLRNKYGY